MTTTKAATAVPGASVASPDHASLCASEQSHTLSVDEAIAAWGMEPTDAQREAMHCVCALRPAWFAYKFKPMGKPRGARGRLCRARALTVKLRRVVHAAACLREYATAPSVAELAERIGMADADALHDLAIEMRVRREHRSPMPRVYRARDHEYRSAGPALVAQALAAMPDLQRVWK